MTVTAMPPATTAEEVADETKPGRRKKLVVVVLLLVLLGGAGYWFLAPADPPPAPEPGEVVSLEPIQVNLSGGHYLRVGIALQASADAHEVEGSKALDATIAVFSGRPLEEVMSPPRREALRGELLEAVDEAYHGDVLDVYFTEYVTQ